MYGSIQSPLVMRTAGRVGVGCGVNVEVAAGIFVAVALGDGIAVDKTGAEVQADIRNSATGNRVKYIFIFTRREVPFLVAQLMPAFVHLWGEI